jgi:hypothetical protein
MGPNLAPRASRPARSEHTATTPISTDRLGRVFRSGFQGNGGGRGDLLVLGSDLVVAQLLHQLRPGYHRRYPGSRRRRRRLRHHRLPAAGPPLLTVSPPVLPDPAGSPSPRPPDLVASGLRSIWWACSCRWIPQRRGGLATWGCGRETNVGKSRPEDDEAKG